jgi:uncharacterized membrane protein
MDLDLALVGFKGQSTAASVFGTLRDRVGSNTPWTNEVAIVEHHANDRMSLRGTFASRYVNVDEADHFSDSGAARGALTGVLLGAVFGPPGWAAGLVLGATIGAETGHATEVEPEPEPLIDELRDAVPSGHSAIALLADPSHVDAMLSALGESGEVNVVRRSLAAEQASALIASVAADPPASRGPIGRRDSVSGA